LTEARLTEGSVGPTLFKLTLPMILGIVSMVIFNLADTFFIGRLGTTELAALSFTFPVVLVVNSLAMGLGIGASAVISRATGEGNTHRVRRLTTDGLILSVLFAVLFVTAGQLTIRPLFRAMGASADILPLIETYMRIWYWGALFVVVPMMGNNAIRAAGDTLTPGLIMMVSAAMNCALDPLLIFGIGPFPRMEIAGAALSTVIARALSMGVALWVLIRRERMITLERPAWETVSRSWGQILYVGLPTAGTRIILPLGMAFVTRMVSVYGKEAVAALGVATRVEFFALAVFMALASVIGPYVGQNRGARRWNRVIRGMRLSFGFCLISGLFLGAVLALLAPNIVRLFNHDPRVVAAASLYLRRVPWAYGLEGIVVIAASALNVLNRPLYAAGLSFMQMFVLVLPLAYIGSGLLGIGGIFLAVAAAYALTGLTSRWMLFRVLRNQREGS